VLSCIYDAKLIAVVLCHLVIGELYSACHRQRREVISLVNVQTADEYTKKGVITADYRLEVIVQSCISVK